MKRRTFIKAGIGTVGATVTGGAAFTGFSLADFNMTLKSIIVEDIAGLKIKEDAVDTFLEEAGKEAYWGRFSTSKRIFLIIQHSLHPTIKLPFYKKYLLARDQITGQFLLSTDFFFSSQNGDREVNYRGFYNPYKSPCQNPFSDVFHNA